MKKYLAIVIGVIGIGIALYAFASSSGPNYTGTGSDAGGASVCDGLGPVWSSPTNIQGSPDGNYASTSPVDLSGGNINIVDECVFIIKGGTTLSTVNRASASAWPTSIAYSSYGSSTDLWGQTWTPADINASNFGVSLAVFTNYKGSTDLDATNFGFSIPSNATISGILVEIDKYQVVGTGSSTAYVDAIRITVYYSLPQTSAFQCQISSGQFQIRSGKFSIQ